MKRDYVPGGNGESTNLYLDPEVKKLGKALASKNPKTSLSRFVELLILAESKRKIGVSRKEAV